MPRGIYTRTPEHIKNISGKNNPMYGKKHTIKTIEKMKENHVGNTGKKMPQSFIKMLKDRKGDKHPRWKGGEHKTYHGYIMFLNPSHPRSNKNGYVRYSHYVMEQHLGRFLKDGEIVHHINHIRDDDRIENLMLFSSNSEHTSFHNGIRKSKKFVI